MMALPPVVTDGFQVRYTARDAILYALAIGFGSTNSDYNHDLCFLYEEHPDFAITPMFGLSFIFWAAVLRHPNNNNNNRIDPLTTTALIPSFPPPMMEAMGIIPNEYLKKSGDSSTEYVQLADCPVLHTFQSITWHRPLPVPCNDEEQSQVVALDLEGTFTLIQPKSIGTFVTTEFAVYHSGTRSNHHHHHSNSDKSHPDTSIRIFTLQSTALIFGLPADQVIPFQAAGAAAASPHRKDDAAVFWFHSQPFSITPSQALWYRLASGDSNRIHVDASSVPMMLQQQQQQDENGSSNPLLHGLCTLGIAGRVIWQQLVQEQQQQDTMMNAIVVHQLEGAFAKPVFVGDRISVQVWRKGGSFCGDMNKTSHHQQQLFFQVCNQSRNGDVVVDHGYMVAEIRPNEEKRSRL